MPPTSAHLTAERRWCAQQVRTGWCLQPARLAYYPSSEDYETSRTGWQAIGNCEAVLGAAGATLGEVVEVGVLLTDPRDLAGVNEEDARWFPADPPARCAATLGAEIPGILISIRMTAYVG